MGPAGLPDDEQPLLCAEAPPPCYGYGYSGGPHADSEAGPDAPLPLDKADVGVAPTGSFVSFPEVDDDDELAVRKRGRGRFRGLRWSKILSATLVVMVLVVLIALRWRVSDVAPPPDDGISDSAALSTRSAASTSKSSSSSSVAAPPHIVLVVGDDIGISDLFVEDDELSAGATMTPTLNALRREGVWLPNFYSQPLCTPARAALMTGKYPLRTGMQHNVIQITQTWGLDADITILPQALKAQGYRTSLMGKWHLGHAYPYFTPLKRGFDDFFGYLTGILHRFKHYSVGACEYSPETDDDPDDVCYMDLQTNGAIDSDNTTYMTELITRHTVSLLDDHDVDTPLFLTLTYPNVHTPIRVEKWAMSDERVANVTAQCRRNYLLDMMLMDLSIATVVDKLKEKGMWDNTVFVFLNDNGAETTSECGYVYPFRGQKDTLFEGGVRTPAFIHSALLPSSVRGQDFKGLFHVTDFVPTLVEGVLGLDLASVGFDADTIDGVNQWPAIVAGNYAADVTDSSYPRQDVVLNVDGYKNREFPVAGIRIGHWKLIVNHAYSGWWVPTGTSDFEVEDTDNATSTVPSPVSGKYDYLFNLEEDPSETVNLYADEPEVVARLRSKLTYYNTTGVYRDPLCCLEEYPEEDVFDVWAANGDHVVPFGDVLAQEEEEEEETADAAADREVAIDAPPSSERRVRGGQRKQVEARVGDRGASTRRQRSWSREVS